MTDYDMNPPDIKDFFEMIANNSNDIIFSGNEIINELKLIAIDQLQTKIPNYKGKKLSEFLECLKQSVEKMIETLSSDSKSNKLFKDKSMLSALLAQMYVTKQVVMTILFEYSKDKKLNLKKFLSEMKSTISSSCKSEYEEESQYESSDDEEDDKKRKLRSSDNKSNKKLRKKDDEEEDDYDEDYEDEDEDDDDDDEDDDDDDDDKNLLSRKIAQKKMDLRKRENKEFLEELMKSSVNDTNGYIYNYFSGMKKEDKNLALRKLKEVNSYQSADEPLLFKLISLDVSIEQKSHILKKYLALISGKGESNKLKSWIDAVATIPFGKFLGTNITSVKSNQIKNFLDNLQKTMDSAVWGHAEAKRHIIQIMGQQFRNPKSKGNIIGIYGPPGNGKCFALDTPILMYDGSFKKVQDIQVGDIVMGDDSKQRNVLSLGSGEDEMYEIISNKNESYTVNSEHILCLKSSGLDLIKKINGKFKVQYFNKSEIKFIYKTFNDYQMANKYLNDLKNNEIDNIVEITVKDYLDLPNYIKNKLKGYKVGVEFNTKQVQFDPYIIGVWLGDGTSDKTNISSQDSRILYYLRTELKKYDLNLQHISNYDYTIVCDTKQNSRDCPNKFKNALKYYDLLKNKHIPEDYLVNDRSTRLKVLAGLIDTDGYYNEDMRNFEIIQKSKRLSDDIIYLARSLGFAAHQHKIKKSCIYNGEEKIGDYYRLHIYGDNLCDIPTLCIRKQCTDNSYRFKNALVNDIKVISKGRGNYYGFTLDGNNRFLLGDFTVTHNTSLVKEGIAKAMNKPFVFISLGGATDSSFLEGHSYTYEGSIYGRIAHSIISSKCMDPIIYFDELDKISKTHKGDEITNLLIHLTDPVQNSHFRDKYFHGIEFDLSKVTFIFSYNDPSLIDRVLMDRITQVETKYLLMNQKIHIAQNYLIPDIMKEIGFEKNAIKISDDIIKHLIDKYTNEGGVRKLKSLLYNIAREINISNLTKTKLDDKHITFPYEVSKINIKTILKHKNEIQPEIIHNVDKCGVINGMYATTSGVGGVMPIEILWAPSTTPYEVKATGNLQQVIKESTQVASTLAFNYLEKEMQEDYLKQWKEKPRGLHIHCPDGSVPKDGPSAGTALSVAIYSILTNKKIRHDIAITGEINLQGKVTAIGGLENKLEGAKKAGVKLALYPKENQKDIDKIIERNPSLIDNELKVQAIETLEEAIKFAIV